MNRSALRRVLSWVVGMMMTVAGGFVLMSLIVLGPQALRGLGVAQYVAGIALAVAVVILGAITWRGRFDRWLKWFEARDEEVRQQKEKWP